MSGTCANLPLRVLVLAAPTIAALLAAADPCGAVDLRDPTRPPATAVAAAAHAATRPEAAPVLSAIIGTVDSRAAIVDGRLVRAGDSVGAYSIDAVFTDGIRYRRAGVSHELHLPRNHSIKKSSLPAARMPIREQ